MEMDILRLIAKHDGKLSWYELDHALVYNGTNPSTLGNMMPTLKLLEENGFIRSEGGGPQPRYYVTDAGLRLLEQSNAMA